MKLYHPRLHPRLSYCTTRVLVATPDPVSWEEFRKAIDEHTTGKYSDPKLRRELERQVSFFVEELANWETTMLEVWLAEYGFVYVDPALPFRSGVEYGRHLFLAHLRSLKQNKLEGDIVRKISTFPVSTIVDRGRINCHIECVVEKTSSEKSTVSAISVFMILDLNKEYKIQRMEFRYKRRKMNRGEKGKMEGDAKKFKEEARAQRVLVPDVEVIQCSEVD
ncbi:hypothetical protein CORC01_06446 [Colletotrichum orchidophilum]|uniref:SnoaL-like domain-containing protein n=1 Tax=Colletotrichum orchidophilum TaxID=1209926 RepID=A0A1G4BA13_9PEZI|nr:uncharacterized protein CORC01_06446 [Colletotrichum orchidophilum]OHE98249.1 hypothetical protein CORC01_06446 [Colletotrichum orchidophilum]